MAIGRPPKYSDPDVMEKDIEEYFKKCDKTIIYKQVVQKGEIIRVPTPTPYTMAGLAMTLNMSREALNNYTDKDIFVDIIARARERIHHQNITMAMVGCYDSRIAALNLASNYGYSDRTIIDTTFRDETVDPESLAMVRAMALQLARGQQPKQIEQGKDDSDPD